MNVLVTIPACSLERPERHAHCRAPRRRCTGAARRANPCKTAPAPCRRPGTRTGQRRGRHPTPRDPAFWTRAKTKAQIRAKGTTERACLFITKNDVCNFKKSAAREFVAIMFGVFLHCTAVLSDHMDHPQPSLSGTVYCGCQPGPTGVLIHPGRAVDQQCANPLAAALLLHCTELKTCVRVRPY